jgi:hypothetical protein
VATRFTETTDVKNKKLKEINDTINQILEVFKETIKYEKSLVLNAKRLLIVAL